MRRLPNIRRIVFYLAVVGLGLLAREIFTPEDGSSPQSTGGGTAVAEAVENRLSGVMVEFEAPVHRVLADDREGSRHQRFIVRIPAGNTILIAHNIDLADRVPVDEGDRVRVRGQFEWNERGGVVHWTHHDPDRRREGGWIELDGSRYR